MNRDHAAAAVLGYTVVQFEDAADLAAGIENHVPRQVRNLARAQARLGRQQHDHAIAQRIAGATGKQEEIVDIC